MIVHQLKLISSIKRVNMAMSSAILNVRLPYNSKHRKIVVETVKNVYRIERLDVLSLLLSGTKNVVSSSASGIIISFIQVSIRNNNLTFNCKL